MRPMLTIVCAAACLAAACANVPGSPPVVVECARPEVGARPGPALVGQSYGMQHSPLPLNSVQFASHDVASRVAVQGLYASRTATDTVELTVRLVSCSSDPEAVRVRTSFLRASQAPAEATSAWRVVHLPARGLSHYTELSTARDVASYLVEIAQDTER